MAFEYTSFASGSSGNCYMVRTDNTAILVDAGIAGKHITAGLEQLDMVPADINGIVLTHEHTDHVKSVRMMGRKCTSAGVFGTKGTLDQIRDKLPENRAEAVGRSQDFVIGDVKVHAVPLSHDAADPVGYTFENGGRKLAIMTDTGCVTEEIYREIRDADSLVLEANHEVNILRVGPYPYPLKRRILSDRGHLSNMTCGDVLGRLLADRAGIGRDMPHVVLGHLSKQNNTPETAFLTVRNVLFEKDFYVGRDLTLKVAKRSEPMELMRV